MFCKNCGAQLDDGAVICPHCGVPTDNFNTPPSPDVHENISDVALAALIISIVGLIISCVLNIVSLVLSIIGIKRSHGKKNINRTMSWVALGVSIGSIVLWIIAAIVLIEIFAILSMNV